MTNNHQFLRKNNWEVTSHTIKREAPNPKKKKDAPAPNRANFNIFLLFFRRRKQKLSRNSTFDSHFRIIICCTEMKEKTTKSVTTWFGSPCFFFAKHNKRTMRAQTIRSVCCRYTHWLIGIDCMHVDNGNIVLTRAHTDTFTQTVARFSWIQWETYKTGPEHNHHTGDDDRANTKTFNLLIASSLAYRHEM